MCLPNCKIVTDHVCDIIGVQVIGFILIESQLCGRTMWPTMAGSRDCDGDADQTL